MKYRYIFPIIECINLFKKALQYDKISGNFIKENLENGDDIIDNSWSAQKLNAMYMDNIIGLRSILDLITKLVFEIENINNIFSKPVKLISNNKYYDDSKSLKIYNRYKNTIFNKSEYNELSILRNDFVHNCSLEPVPNFVINKVTDPFYKKSIYCCCCYLWDIEDNGKPSRWINRQRFFGKKTTIDEYILKWFSKILIDIDTTIDHIANHYKMDV